MIVLRDNQNLPRDPKEVQRELLLRASRLGVRLDVKTELRFPSGPNGERLPHYEVATGCVVGGSVAQAENLIDTLEAMLAPAEADEVEAWLAELSVIVAKRQDDEFSESLRLDAYCSRLRAYPADVAHYALLKCTWKFWPTWSDLEAVCKRLTTPRQMMLLACRNPKPDVQIEYRPERVDPTKASEILDSAGFTPKRFEQVSKRPMAGNIEELYADHDRNRVPHWTENEGPDSERIQQLRAARLQNPMMRESMGIRDAAE